jgi:hypothetical protein
MGTILLVAPFNPPDETYSVTIPSNQRPGLTRLIAGHLNIVGVSLEARLLVVLALTRCRV